MRRAAFLLTEILLLCTSYSLGGDFINYSLDAEVKAITFQEDTVWLGTTSGAVKMDQEGNILEEYRPQLGGGGIAGYTVYCVWVDSSNGYVWFGTGMGLSRFDGENWATFDTSDGARGMEISAFAIDGDGRKWVGTWEKASVWIDSVWNEGEQIWEYNYWEQILNLPNPVVTDILIVPGRDFKCVSTQWGVSQYSNGYEHLNNFSSIQGVPGMRVFNLDVDSRDYVWIAAESGIAAFHCDSYNFTDIPYSYTEDDGLISNQVNHLAVDKSDNVWVATWNGISKLNVETEEFLSYDTSDGISTNVVKTVEVDPYGNVWFGTPDGVSKLPVSSGTEDSYKSAVQNFKPVLTYKNHADNIEISLGLEKRGDAELLLYDFKGKLVKSIYRGRSDKGIMNFSIKKRDVTSGSYILFLETEKGVYTRIFIITN